MTLLWPLETRFEEFPATFFNWPFLTLRTSPKIMSSTHSDDVHRRVERLSITVSDGPAERAKFLHSVSEEGSKDTSAIADDEQPMFNLGGLTKAEKSQARRRRRSSVQQGNALRKKKFLSHDPTFAINPVLPKKVTISSLRDLIMYALTDVNSIPRWCTVENRKSIQRVVVVFLRGLCESDFGLESFKDRTDPAEFGQDMNPHLNSFKTMFDKVVPLQSPGSKKCIFSTYTSLVSYSLSPKEKEQIQKENEKRKIALPDLYLTLDDMLAYGYPIHSKVAQASTEMVEKTADYVETKDFHHEGSRTFALDCEFCKSATGKVLARVSLTDFNNNILIDEFIKPDDEIIDYLTQWSGITPEKLEGVETTLEDIQNEILKHVSQNDTLIGHSLESDLHVLRMKHPRIVDTSICFDHQRGPPAKPSLKSLMLQHLEREVQASVEGHNPVEDCISCMDLVKLKIHKGYLYGKSYNMESLYTRLAKSNKLVLSETGQKVPKSALVVDYSVPRTFGLNCETRMQARSDDQVVDLFKANQNKHDLVIIKLRELEWFRGLAGDPMPEGMILPKSEDEMLDLTSKRLGEIYDALEPNSILAISTENGDTREMLRLQAVQKAFNAKYRNGDAVPQAPTPEEDWTEQKAADLHEAILEARNTLFLCTLKQRVQTETPDETL